MDATVKPRIMLIPDAVDWILGTWAKEIRKWNSARYEFVIFPLAEIQENPALFHSALAQSDSVHCLTPWGYSAVREAIAKTEYQHLELISTIHHIVKLSQVADCLKADKIMVVCQKYLNELAEQGVPRKKLVLVYNGVDTDRFSPRDAAIARRTFGIPTEAFVVGFSGKATSDHDGRKGIDVFCSTLSRLRGRIKTDIHVILTGPGWKHLQRHSAFKNVAFHYFPFLPSSKMPEFYNAANAYLVTARVEGGPVPLLEAMSCGVPVVTTPVGTALDFVRDVHNGLTVPIDNVGATVDAIERIHRDRGLASRLGAAGRETILENLQWKNTVLKVDQLYGAPRSGRSWTAEHATVPFPCAQLSAELIANDTARWEHRMKTETERYRRAKKLAALPKRLSSRVVQSLRSCFQ